MTGDVVHLAIEGLGKSFGAPGPSTTCRSTIAAGSVHALVGENGAGKSTLGKIIAGVLAAGPGSLTPARRARRRSARRAHALERGIALVAQEVALVPHLTVAENVFLGVEPRRAGFIDRRALAERFRALAAEAGFDLPHRRPGRPPAHGQAAAGRDPARPRPRRRADRPRRADRRLSAAEVERLHAIVRMLAARGQHGHPRVALPARGPRPGRHGHGPARRPGRVRPSPPRDETEDSLIAAMLGRSVGADLPAQAAGRRRRPGRARRARTSSAPGVHGVTLQVRAGEIVGLAGLVGAGRTELARAIYGAPTTQRAARRRPATDGRSRARPATRCGPAWR